MFLEISQNTHENTCVRVSFLIKLQVWHRYFPVNFAKFLRIPFLQNTSGRLLLYQDSSQQFNCLKNFLFGKKSSRVYRKLFKSTVGRVKVMKYITNFVLWVFNCEYSQSFAIFIGKQTQASNFIKKEALAQVSCEIFKNTFVIKRLHWWLLKILIHKYMGSFYAFLDHIVIFMLLHKNLN